MFLHLKPKHATTNIRSAVLHSCNNLRWDMTTSSYLQSYLNPLFWYCRGKCVIPTCGRCCVPVQMFFFHVTFWVITRMNRICKCVRFLLRFCRPQKSIRLEVANIIHSLLGIHHKCRFWTGLVIIHDILLSVQNVIHQCQRIQEEMNHKTKQEKVA